MAKNEGIVRLLRELVEQIEVLSEDMDFPTAKVQPHDVGDDMYDLALAGKKAKKLLAMHDRDISFDTECEAALVRVADYKVTLEQRDYSKMTDDDQVGLECLDELSALLNRALKRLRQHRTT